MPVSPLSPSGPVFRGWLGAVSHLHRAGLVHRDLCPRNTLVAPSGHVYLLDLDEVVTAGVHTDVVGTPGFLAPELTQGGAASPASDLFALGQVLDASAFPVLHALTTASRPEWRAATVDELRAALPLLEGAPAFSGGLRGPAALHDVTARAAALRARRGGRRILDRLCASGFGHLEADGSRTLHPSELHRWEALLDPDTSVLANRRRVVDGIPGRAVWSLLRSPRPLGEDPVAWLDTLGWAALHTHDPRMIRRVRAELVPRSGDVVAWWKSLLEAALAVYAGQTTGVLEAVAGLAIPDRPEARQAREVVLFRVALARGVATAQAVLAEVVAAGPRDDADAPARWDAWRGLLAYRAGDLDAACVALEAAWPRRVQAHEAVLAASNLAAVWLHRDQPGRAEAVARSALQRLPPGGHPFAAARLAAKMREAVYRGHAAPTPDPQLLGAIRGAGPPFAVALATLHEAAAAWRAGDHDLGRSLAHDAAGRFERAGLSAGHALAGALAHRLRHPAWIHEADRLEAAVDDMVDEDSGVWLPALAAQVLGLLADGPSDPRAEDAAELARDSGLPSEPRREVLSLAEAARGAEGL